MRLFMRCFTPWWSGRRSCTFPWCDAAQPFLFPQKISRIACAQSVLPVCAQRTYKSYRYIYISICVQTHINLHIYIHAHTNTQTRTCPSRDILSTSFKTMTLKRPPAAVEGAWLCAWKIHIHKYVYMNVRILHTIYFHTHCGWGRVALGQAENSQLSVP